MSRFDRFMDRTVVEHPGWSIAVTLLTVGVLSAVITTAVMGLPWDIRQRHVEVPACVVPR